MVDGKLLKFIDRKINGDLIYTSALPNTKLGGLMPSRQTIPLSLVHPKNAELEYALLEIGTITPSQNIQWRVKVNGISVTKEFHPQTICPAGRDLFAKSVYDITSILKTPESLRKKRANITFKLEGGESIIIEHLSILAIYRSEEAEGNVTFLSGTLSLKPGEETTINLNYSGQNNIFRTTLYMPSSIALGSIVINGNELIKIENIQGIDELYLELPESLNEITNITIRHNEATTTYYPKEMRLSNILIYSIKYNAPNLVIEGLDKEYEITKDNNEITLNITNKGTSKPDNALIVVMSLG
ncbi:MAG: hypothetical protein J7L82_03475, partial [Staphylothermus sp.]|nr:hypothetical protein [Staphylothermus sp.]